MKIHLYKKSKRMQHFFFTKNKDNCLMVTYDEKFDFGINSCSGTTLDEIKIHYQNGFIFSEDHKEITLNEVPRSIKDVLTFLK